MMGEKVVKPVNLGRWISLLDEYHVTSLQFDAILRGVLRPGLSPASPEVVAALDEWPEAAYLQSENGSTEVVLVYQAREVPKRVPWLQVGLFVATLMTTLAAGALMAGRDPLGTEVLTFGGVVIPYPSGIDWQVLFLGAPFALPFLGILLAHEMGHYAAAVAHRVRVTLPYFIPFPPYFSIIGTVGAFIRLKSPMVRRVVLFDVGSSGPMASFVLSAPLFAVGLGLSEPVAGDVSLATPFAINFVGQTVWLGNSPGTHLLAALFAPGSVGESLILLHPFALVGWLGLFVTALNLLPLGQLDGGHILYALIPKRHGTVAKTFLFVLIPLGFIWWGWWAWAFLVLFINKGQVNHPKVVQPEKTIDRGRRFLGWAMIAMFFLTFVPVPLEL